MLCDRFKPGDWAWIGVGAVVVSYEAYAAGRRENYELLSEACDRYRRSYPIATNLTIAYLAAHLARVVPRRVDPLHILATRCTWRAP